MKEQDSIPMGEGNAQATGPSRHVGPTPPHERLAVLDVLRGFAIFGILLVNMAGYSSPISDLGESAAWWKGRADRTTALLIQNVGSGKFLFLFSLLFGISFGLQLIRNEDGGGPLAPFYRRRLSVLLLIGLMHGFLVWWADILVPFAVMGGLLFLFRRWNPRNLLILAISLFLLSFVPWEVMLVRRLSTASVPDPSVRAEQSSESVEGGPVEAALRAYGSGTFKDIMAQRFKDVVAYYEAAAIEIPRDFAFFLLGLYAGRRKIFQDLPLHLALIRKICRWGLGLGLAGHLALQLISLPAMPTWVRLLRPPLTAAALPALMLFYASAFVLLFQVEPWRHWLIPFAAVGRMSLSNYLFQSLVCTTFFYSYGLGLYGKIGPAKGLLFTAAIFAVQTLLSVLWLRRFRFGPTEWLWRSLTYGNLQPITVSSYDR